MLPFGFVQGTEKTCIVCVNSPKLRLRILKKEKSGTYRDSHSEWQYHTQNPRK